MPENDHPPRDPDDQHPEHEYVPRHGEHFVEGPSLEEARGKRERPDRPPQTHLVDPAELLRVVARAIRAAGPALVLASIDSLDERHMGVNDVIAKLRRLGRLTGGW
jgi:hypothetical protein